MQARERQVQKIESYGNIKINTKAKSRRAATKFFDSADWAMGRQLTPIEQNHTVLADPSEFFDPEPCIDQLEHISIKSSPLSGSE